jgi:hypothetical protein
MKSVIRSALAVAATAALAGCASYDYGYPYGSNYNYGYDNGPYSYNDGYYYDYGSSYVAPSVGFGFTYRDRDRDGYDRDYYRHRNDSRDYNDYRRGDTTNGAVTAILRARQRRGSLVPTTRGAARTSPTTDRLSSDVAPVLQLHGRDMHLTTLLGLRRHLGVRRFDASGRDPAEMSLAN